MWPARYRATPYFWKSAAASGMSLQHGRCPAAMIQGRFWRLAAAALRSFSSHCRYSPFRPKLPAGKEEASPWLRSSAEGKSVSVFRLTKCTGPTLKEYHMLSAPPEVACGMCQRLLNAVKLFSLCPYLSVWIRHCAMWHSDSWLPGETMYGTAAATGSSQFIKPSYAASSAKPRVIKDARRASGRGAHSSGGRVLFEAQGAHS